MPAQERGHNRVTEIDFAKQQLQQLKEPNTSQALEALWDREMMGLDQSISVFGVPVYRRSLMTSLGLAESILHRGELHHSDITGFDAGLRTIGEETHLWLGYKKPGTENYIIERYRSIRAPTSITLMNMNGWTLSCDLSEYQSWRTRFLWWNYDVIQRRENLAYPLPKPQYLAGLLERLIEAAEEVLA